MVKVPGNRFLSKVGTPIGLATAVVLAGLAYIGWAPTHRSPVAIQDQFDFDITPEYDALLLEGWRDGETYTVKLTVRGTVQPSRYVVGVLVRDFDEPDEPYLYVYDLEYQFGEEENYGVPAFRQGGSLIFLFPLNMLRGNAYIVGLDAVVWNLESGDADYVDEEPMEDLEIQHILQLPFHPILLLAAAIGIALISAVILGRIVG